MAGSYHNSANCQHRWCSFAGYMAPVYGARFLDIAAVGQHNRAENAYSKAV